jgi:hypothetical protein
VTHNIISLTGLISCTTFTIVYGSIEFRRLFHAKKVTIEPNEAQQNAKFLSKNRKNEKLRRTVVEFK